MIIYPVFSFCLATKVRSAEMRIAETRVVNRALPGWLRPFPLWIALIAWRPQVIGVLPDLCQGTLEKELEVVD